MTARALLLQMLRDETEAEDVEHVDTIVCRWRYMFKRRCVASLPRTQVSPAHQLEPQTSSDDVARAVDGGRTDGVSRVMDLEPVLTLPRLFVVTDAPQGQDAKLGLWSGSWAAMADELRLWHVVHFNGGVLEDSGYVAYEVTTARDALNLWRAVGLSLPMLERGVAAALILDI